MEYGSTPYVGMALASPFNVYVTLNTARKRLERCRDGRYTVNASRFDVWVVCARLPVCIVTCFVGLWGSVLLVEVHPYMSAFALCVKCFLYS